jgi:hypothetical protein
LHAALIRQHPPSFASAASASLFFFSDSLLFYFTSPSCCGGAARFLVCVWCVCVQVGKYFSTTCGGAARFLVCVWCVCRLASTLVPLIFKFEVLQFFVQKKKWPVPAAGHGAPLPPPVGHALRKRGGASRKRRDSPPTMPSVPWRPALTGDDISTYAPHAAYIRSACGLTGLRSQATHTRPVRPSR